MGDLLLYRLPSGGKVRKTGVFERTSIENCSNCFVVTSFDKKDVFQFVEGDVETSIFRNKKDPNCITRDVYLRDAKCFLDRLVNDKLEKAVFSRVKNGPLIEDPIRLFDRLCEVYPKAFVYLISSSMFGTWIGATPEVLLETEQGIGSTMALAGTLASKEEEWSEKERLEQQYVTEFIEAKLTRMDCSILSEKNTTEMVAGPVRHLVSKFQFELNEKLPMEIADGLHPTPAVSGLPQEKAVELIQDIEGHDRSLYAGMIGIVSNEKTSLFVNLRCAQLGDSASYFYVGGGFTCDSNIEKEWKETENKAKTLLQVIQNL